jgi:hypothetical protein
VPLPQPTNATHQPITTPPFCIFAPRGPKSVLEQDTGIGKTVGHQTVPGQDDIAIGLKIDNVAIIAGILIYGKAVLCTCPGPPVTPSSLALVYCATNHRPALLTPFPKIIATASRSSQRQPQLHKAMLSTINIADSAIA